MPFQIVNPNLPPDPFAKRIRKQARERLDRLAEQEKVGWKGVQLLAQDLFGKTKDFSLGECKILMERIKEKRK